MSHRRTIQGKDRASVMVLLREDPDDLMLQSTFALHFSSPWMDRGCRPLSILSGPPIVKRGEDPSP